MPPQQTTSGSGIKWHEVTWYSKLGAIMLFIGVVPALCFYFGTQFEEVKRATLQPQIEHNQARPISKVAVAAPATACDPLMSTLTRNECMEKENDQLRSDLHDLYTKINTSLMQYAEPTRLDERSIEFREEYFANILKNLEDAETSGNTSIAAYCSALTEHYRLFGGTIGGFLYNDCVRQGLLNEKTLLKKLFENNSVSKTPLQLE